MHYSAILTKREQALKAKKEGKLVEKHKTTIEEVEADTITLIDTYKNLHYSNTTTEEKKQLFQDIIDFYYYLDKHVNSHNALPDDRSVRLRYCLAQIQRIKKEIDSSSVNESPNEK